MRITFVLPGPANGPVGGFKTVYEYANRLVARGHDVTVAHPMEERLGRGVGPRLAQLRDRARLVKQGRPDLRWHTIDPRVKMTLPADMSPARLPDADVVVATAWETARALADAPASKGRRIYFIQHLETWSGSEEDVMATWRLPMDKIVCARWLYEIAEEIGEAGRATYIPSGLDLDEFGIDVPLADRDPRTVGMLVHSGQQKSVGDGLAALELARGELPGLSCVAFGVDPAPAGLPEWVDYAQLPPPAELRARYNRCAVFLQPSRREGFGLPAVESMLCGCALVTADNGGSRDYAFDGRTALVAPPGEPDALAERVVRLAGDPELRRRLAEAGHEHARTYSWSSATDAFEAVLSARRSRR